MKRTGLNFYVEGEYCEDLEDDPDEQKWIPFGTTDLHPEGKYFITIWSQFEEPTQADIKEMSKRAMYIVEYFRDEKDWPGFVASLWLSQGGGKDRRVMNWNLA